MLGLVLLLATGAAAEQANQLSPAQRKRIVRYAVKRG